MEITGIKLTSNTGGNLIPSNKGNSRNRTKFIFRYRRIITANDKYCWCYLINISTLTSIFHDDDALP